MKHYKSIFISDVHLGTRGCQADALCLFLKNNTSDNLFLVGDIIDGWKLRKKWFFPQSHANVIRRILTLAKKGTNVYYIIGNHDEGIRKFLNYDINIGSIQIINSYDYTGVDNKRYLVVHGDIFDKLMIDKYKWMMHLGDTLYELLIWVNIHFNSIRKLLGLKYWSLSKWLKDNTKQAVNFINKYENYIADYCIENNYNGIICGHIHHAEIKKINGVLYMNDGDWVESATALLEHTDGTWEIYYDSSK